MEDSISLKNMKVLLIDDVPANLELLSHMIEEHGFKVFTETSGEAALKFLENKTPDIILLDIMMGGIDGFETCKQIKDNPLTKAIPIIFLTAKSGSEHIVKGFQLGGVDYITKSFNSEEVISRITAHLKIRKLTQEREKLNKILEEQNTEITESNNQLRVMLEKSSDGIFRLNSEGKVLHSNYKFYASLGLNKDEIRDKSLSELVAQPESKELFQIATRRFGDRATYGKKVDFLVKDSSLSKENGSVCSLLIDSFGIWNLPNNVVMEKGVDKKFLGTLCIVKKPL
jgi:PAS domain S-box-containing protein